jgi:DNA polymerase type B, organellar and viral
LESLAKDLCPELGTKGNVDHATVGLMNLKERKEELLNYMKQDIIILAGVMLKAQELVESEFSIDIVKKITLSSLALTIFRRNYYNMKMNPIYTNS